MKLKIESIAFHRNGICGAGFYAVLFTDPEQGLMYAALFDEPGHCAVVNVVLLAKGNVAFGENSWRGDQYESALRPLVAAFEKSQGLGRVGPFSAIPESAISEAPKEQQP